MLFNVFKVFCIIACMCGVGLIAYISFNDEHSISVEINNIIVSFEKFHSDEEMISSYPVGRSLRTQYGIGFRKSLNAGSVAIVGVLNSWR